MGCDARSLTTPSTWPLPHEGHKLEWGSLWLRNMFWRNNQIQSSSSLHSSSRKDKCLGPERGLSVTPSGQLNIASTTERHYYLYICCLRFGWHLQLNGHEFEQTLGDSEGQGSKMCYSSWVAKSWTGLSKETTAKIEEISVCPLLTHNKYTKNVSLLNNFPF